MKTGLIIFDLVLSLLLIGAILLQPKGTGLDSSFGGSGEFYQSRRGIEKGVTYGTIALTVLFAGVSLALLLLP